MSLNLANVELSDSFNTWRLRTNSIITRSLQGTGTALSTANTQFNGRVTTNNILNVNNTIVFLRSTSINGTSAITVRPNITFSNTTTFSSAPTFSSGLTTTTVVATGSISGSLLTVSDTITATNGITGGSFTTTGAISGGSVSATGAITGASATVTNALTGKSLALSGPITGASTLSVVNSITANAATITTVTATDFNSTSDKRFKENISTIETPLDIVGKLEGVRFKWKESNKPSIGLIAQDVEEVLPEIVHTDDQGIKYINYGLLTALLIESIKQQQAIINTLTKS